VILLFTTVHPALACIGGGGGAIFLPSITGGESERLEFSKIQIFPITAVLYSAIVLFLRFRLPCLCYFYEDREIILGNEREEEGIVKENDSVPTTPMTSTIFPSHHTDFAYRSFMIYCRWLLQHGRYSISHFYYFIIKFDGAKFLFLNGRKKFLTDLYNFRFFVSNNYNTETLLCI